MTSREWRGLDDLPAMQALAAAQRRLAGRRALWHPGDLAWGMRQHAGREAEWRVRLWEDGGDVVAWTWIKRENGDTEFDVRQDRRALLGAMFADPAMRTVRAFADDDESAAALARQGFTERLEWEMHFNARALDAAPVVPSVPAGFRLRSVERADLAERVAVHRDVWAPSRVTEESFANVRSTWPYRDSLDCVLEAPNGEFAAYCLLWPDDDNGVGELEPVGTREAYRRRGLGAAVCAFALRRWYEQGGREAIVYCATEPACALYESLGFRRYATLAAFTRSPGLELPNASSDL